MDTAHTRMLGKEKSKGLLWIIGTRVMIMIGMSWKTSPFSSMSSTIVQVIKRGAAWYYNIDLLFIFPLRFFFRRKFSDMLCKRHQFEKLTMGFCGQEIRDLK